MDSSVWCLTFTAQNDVRAEFDTRKLFSLSSAEGGQSLCAHLKSDFKTGFWAGFCDITILWKSLVVQYATYTSAMWKLPAHIH